MTSSSPSEFLTFMRHVAVRSPLRPSTIHPRPSIAQSAGCRIAASQARYGSSGVTTHGYGPGKKEHAVNKEGLDIQSNAANKAKSDRAKAEGGKDNTTSERDTMKSTEKAKKDHPEAPDVIIGMQDERGQRGH